METGYMYGAWEGQARARGAGGEAEDTDDDDDDRSDDNPLLSYRYEKYRGYTEPPEERGRRGGPLGALVKFSLFCTAMILFCVLMYIPMYNRVLERIPKDVVTGWNIDTNRDTKVYVQPDNITTLHQPRILCSSGKRKEKLYLLIVVCSDTSNFERRIAIRETWGSHRKYLQLEKIFKLVRERYKTYNYSYNLYPNSTLVVDTDDEEVLSNRTKRDAGFMQLLPKIAEVLKRNIEDSEIVTEERRFQDDEEKLAEFDMNKAFDTSNQDLQNYEYDYDTNVMKIPPNGEQESPDLNKIMSILRKSKLGTQEAVKATEMPEDVDEDVDFKLLFLLGLPSAQNKSEVQDRIEMEVEKYGDVIQENFIDSYNNLTLKSIMMLKWVKHNCNNSLRYILKTDDDMYINTPNLLETLRNRSAEWARRAHTGDEFLLAGDQIYGARPVLDAKNKWFSPRYMYGARVYPRYLSGTGYLLSVAAASVLYRAALSTPYFHLEDVFITGICAARASPRLKPAALPHFAAHARRSGRSCAAFAHVALHRVAPPDLRRIDRRLRDPALVDTCERMRLTQVRKDRIRARLDAKKKLTALNARFKTNSRSGVLGL